MRTRMLRATRSVWLGTAVAALALVPPLDGRLGPASLAGQAGSGGEEPDVVIGGLLRTGFVIGPGDEGARDGFEVFDARLRAGGRIGIVFDYFVQGEFDTRGDELRLLDARLRLPITQGVNLDVGQFKAPLSRELLQGKGEITFLERAQVVHALAPGRQVGVQLGGDVMDGRLTYAAGVFNGNGRELENDNDDFLYAGRVVYKNVGIAEFYDELVVEVGLNAAFSVDSAVSLRRDVAPRSRGFRMSDRFEGDRLVYGGDLRLGYRGFFLRGEYLRGEFDPDVDVFVDVLDRASGLVSVAAVSLDDVQGGYLEGGYNLWGAVEAVVRWDAIEDFLPESASAALEERGGDFLVFGVSLFPGYRTKLALQYAVGLAGAEVGPGLADGEFVLNAQVDF